MNSGCRVTEQQEKSSVWRSGPEQFVLVRSDMLNHPFACYRSRHHQLGPGAGGRGMTIGAGIATAGIWIAVGVIGWKTPTVAPFVVIFAFWATCAVNYQGD
jgi:hypothetical protein